MPDQHGQQVQHRKGLARFPASWERSTHRFGMHAALTVALGSLWGGAFSLIGLWMISASASVGPIAARGWAVRAGIGVSLLMAGQLVFLILSAERVFPDAPESLTRRCLQALVLIGVLGIAVSAVAWFLGGLA